MNEYGNSELSMSLKVWIISPNAFRFFGEKKTQQTKQFHSGLRVIRHSHGWVAEVRPCITQLDTSSRTVYEEIISDL